MATQITSSGTLGLVTPLSLPDASPINYNGGDVRHPSKDVGLDAVTMANTTRQLAYRDVLLAEKLNELLAVVNNKEQLMNLPAVRTQLSPGESVVVTNNRIPPGYEARLLNAIVSSTPVAQQVLLELLYNQNDFGQVTGTTVVASTMAESGAGTSFYSTGEFVVRLTNEGTTPTESVYSILMTVRPVSAQTGGIIGPGVVGEKGDKGDKGDTGTGYPGPPGAPSGPGLVWRGSYNGTFPYGKNDCMSYDWDGTTGLVSYVNLVPSTGVAPPFPTYAPSYNWDLLSVAARGAKGDIGNTGTQGFQYMGYFDAGTLYQYGAVVLNGTGTSQTVVWYNDGASTSNVPPALPWQPLFGPFTGPIYVQSSVPVNVVPQPNFVAGPAVTGYDVILVGTAYPFPFVESTVYGGPPAQAYSSMSWLRGRAALSYFGNIQVDLPTQANSARANWTVSDVALRAEVHGAPYVFGGTVPLVTVIAMGGTAFDVSAWGTNLVEITITGEKPGYATN